MGDSKILLSKTPLRISLFGGRTDLSNFYKQEYGYCINTTINKYIYIRLEERTDNNIGLYYLNHIETTDQISNILHPIIKACLQEYPVYGINLFIASDIPAGSGLGSSSCLTVGLINVLTHYLGCPLTKYELAAKACEIEINKLHHPIGKQDQFACAYGGLNSFSFHKNGEVQQHPIEISSHNLTKLDDNLMLIYTNISRDANAVLTQTNQVDNFSILKNIKNQAIEVETQLKEKDIDTWFGKELHKEWELKKSLSNIISNSAIDKYYETALSVGAIGGKLLGAGSGGYLLLYADKQNQNLIQDKLNLPILTFNFENKGSQIL